MQIISRRSIWYAGVRRKLPERVTITELKEINSKDNCCNHKVLENMKAQVIHDIATEQMKYGVDVISSRIADLVN